MTQQRMRRDGKPWHNNIGPWIKALTADEKKAPVQKATRAQWGPVKEGPKKADDGAWIWPFDVNKYDRQGELSVTEADVLTRYAEAYRFYRFGRTMDFGPVLDRIIRTLNDALDYTGARPVYEGMCCCCFSGRLQNGGEHSGHGRRKSGSIRSTGGHRDVNRSLRLPIFYAISQTCIGSRAITSFTCVLPARCSVPST